MTSMGFGPAYECRAEGKERREISLVSTRRITAHENRGSRVGYDAELGRGESLTRPGQFGDLTLRPIPYFCGNQPGHDRGLVVIAQQPGSKAFRT